MSDTASLVERLRRHAVSDRYTDDLCREAAEALEAQQARITQLTIMLVEEAEKRDADQEDEGSIARKALEQTDVFG